MQEEEAPVRLSQGNAIDGLDFLLDGFTLQMIAGVLMGMAWCLFGVGSPIYRVYQLQCKSCCN
jgi:hypothetical protein